MSIAVHLPDVDLTSQSTAGNGAGWASWNWQCPSCHRSYESELDVCIEDGAPLNKVGFSLPFIWIG